jgi:hypothetical protein
LGNRSVRLQFEGSDGERYTIKLEGRLSKDKVLRLMDMYELLARENETNSADESTVFGRIKNLITQDFTFKQFTSDQIRDAFEDTYNQPMKLAEVSTYLTRMTDLKEVSRVKQGRKWLYKLSPLSEAFEPVSNQNRQFRQIIDR